MTLKIDIIVDTVCPWCYVGKKRFERALALRPGVDIEVGWRAFQLNPDMPLEGMDRSAYVEEKFGGMERANAVNSSLKSAGEAEGIKFSFNAIQEHLILYFHIVSYALRLNTVFKPRLLARYSMLFS